jgi:Polyketide cyclase / dehydrase and lipid transport
MDSLTHSDSIIVARTPQELYELVSDITRMGEFSPICKACWWEEGGGPRVGAWFGGRNELPERTWETRSEVVVADPGREFAFVVNGTIARWGYTFSAVEGGTELTESWEFLPGGRSVFEERFGDDAEAQVADRYEKAKTGIPETLAAIKRTAEAQPAS